MPDLSAYDIPLDDLEDRLVSWAGEALEHRHGAGEDPEGPLGPIPYESGVTPMVLYLVRVVARADRVAALLAKTTQAQARARRAQAEAKFAAEREFDTSMSTVAKRAGQFASGREKVSEASLDSFEARRVAHRAARVVSVADEAHEIVRQVHWQLDGLRKDVRATIHAAQFESSLER